MAGGDGASAGLPYVIIAQQSYLPHYRVKLFERLAELSAGAWRFAVVCDADQAGALEGAGFAVIPVKTRRLAQGDAAARWQNLLPAIKSAQCLVTDTHIKNLGYLAAARLRPAGCKWLLWGHTHNLNAGPARRTMMQRVAEGFKLGHLRRADGFLAYTPGQRRAAQERLGLAAEVTHVVPNTIDVAGQREIALAQRDEREELRRKLGLEPGVCAFLFVGRLVPERRVEFLLESLDVLHQYEPGRFRLICLTDKPLAEYTGKPVPEYVMERVGVTDAAAVGEYCTAADACIMPGSIGLGALQPLAHELPVIGFNLPTHGPEFTYMNPTNMTCLPGNMTVREFAGFLQDWVASPLARWDEGRYLSVSRLTIDSMAAAFDGAIRKALGLS